MAQAQAGRRPSPPQRARQTWGKSGVRSGEQGQFLNLLVRAISARCTFKVGNKESYEAYDEAALNLLRPGGLIVVDSVLWHGAVADDTAQDEETRALRAFNAKLHRPACRTQPHPLRRRTDLRPQALTGTPGPERLDVTAAAIGVCSSGLTAANGGSLHHEVPSCPGNTEL
jgi:hypothetical protein